VYMQQILHDKFSYDKFYLLVWTCQQVYFDNLLVASWPVASNAQITLTSFLCWAIQRNKICTLPIFSMTSTLVQKLAWTKQVYTKFIWNFCTFIFPKLVYIHMFQNLCLVCKKLTLQTGAQQDNFTCQGKSAAT
jgi:hypothetical protein